MGEMAAEGVRVVWALAAGPVADLEETTGWLQRPDKVVAADGGLHLAERLGLVPDMVVGDFDSSSPGEAERLAALGVGVRWYEHTTKLETDTELAVLAALEWQPEQIYVIGAMGGRLDHELANVLLLTHAKLADVDVRVVEGRQEVFLAKRATWNAVPGEVGDTVTLLPVGVEASGVTTDGLEYPLADANLLPGHGRGVSNSIVRAGARVRLEAGLMLIVVLHQAGTAS